MKKITPLVLGVIIFSLLFASTPIKAQDKEPADSSTFKGFGKHALQFQVHDFFDISEFQGGMLSYKYHFNNRNAVRVGVDLDGENFDENIDTESVQSDTSFTPGYDRVMLEELEKDEREVEKRIDLLIQSQFLKYFSPFNEIKVYGGIGPTFKYNDRRVTDDNEERDQRTKIFIDTTFEDDTEIRVEDLDVKQERTLWGIGLNGVLGTEWFFHESMSLTAEYGYTVMYEQIESNTSVKQKIRIEEKRLNRQIERVEEIERVSEGDGWRYFDNRVKLGLTVYFGKLFK